jgi:uncharacterized membrane protein YgcG
MHRVIPIIEVDMAGRVSERRIPITQLKEESHLHMRELLVVEAPARSIQNRILPRRHVIVIVISNVRAIVFTDRVYIFNSRSLPGVMEYANALAAHIAGQGVVKGQREAAAAAAAAAAARTGGTLPPPTSPPASLYDDTPSPQAPSPSSGGGGGGGGDKEATPFELLVTEHVLVTQVMKQARRVGHLNKLLERQLARIVTVERDDGNLAALFPLANTVNHLDMVTRGLGDCIRDLLDDDRDMREACLTEKRRNAEALRAEEEARWEEMVEGGLAAPTSSSSSISSAEPVPDAAGGSRAVSAALWAESARPVPRGGRVPPASSYSSSSPPSPSPSSPSSAGPNPYSRHLVHPHANAHPSSSLASLHQLEKAVEDRILDIPSDSLSQLELMLESVYHAAAETNMQLVEMGRTVKAKQDLLEIQQSNYRNWILSATLRLSLLSVSLTSGAFVTSAFGQNLVSGLEGVPGLLWGVTAGGVGLGFGMYRFLDRHTLSSSPTRPMGQRLEALHDFVNAMDSKVATAQAVILEAATRHERERALGREASAALLGTAAGAGAGAGDAAAAAVAAAAAAASSSAPQPSLPPFPLPRNVFSHEFAPSFVSDAFGMAYSAAGGRGGGGTGGGGGGSGGSGGGGGGGGAGAGGHANDAAVAMRSRSLSKAEFTAAYERLCGKRVTQQEVDILFDVFDQNSDGRLDLDEVLDIAATAATANSAAGRGKE